MSLTPLVAGNWKMNGLVADLEEFQSMEAALAAGSSDGPDLLICPPVTLIREFSAVSQRITIGSQDCHFAKKGAFTGDLSAQMLIEAGATITLVGHSERRDMHNEDDALVKKKAEAALAAGLSVIVCVGENLDERQQGNAVERVVSQISGSLPAIDGAQQEDVFLAVAYEPVWAIGTGKVPTTTEIGEMHAAIRVQLVNMFGNTGKTIRILYGGSVNPNNAADVLAVPDVNGVLVGGASLNADSFLRIIEAAND